MNKRVLLPLSLLLTAMIAVLIIGSMSIKSAAKSSDQAGKIRTYHSIEIHPNDTLWDIAEAYAEDNGYTVKAYINELKDINNMKGSKLVAGAHLIIVQYE